MCIANVVRKQSWQSGGKSGIILLLLEEQQDDTQHCVLSCPWQECSMVCMELVLLCKPGGDSSIYCKSWCMLPVPSFGCFT